MTPEKEIRKMYINEVISFRGAWEDLTENNSSELDDIVKAYSGYQSIPIDDSTPNKRRKDEFERLLFEESWKLQENVVYTSARRRVPVRMIGPTKKGVAVQISGYGPDILTRWLYTHSTLAVRYELVKIPILIIPEIDDQEKRKNIPARWTTLKYQLEQLEMLEPLSVMHQFAIISLSTQGSLIGSTVHEIEQLDVFDVAEPGSIVDRCIEFPAEYQQAGIGILSYFATYLSDVYPDEDATVKIEQSGLQVRMIIEADGNTEVIEKALHEYELIVSGSKNIAEVTSNEKVIVELRNELRIAKVRIESQQDLLALQNKNNSQQQKSVEMLMKMVGDGLKFTGIDRAISIEVNPIIQNKISSTVNQDISLSMGNVGELIELLPTDSRELLPLKDLEQALSTIESEADKNVVKKSSALKKFRNVVDQLADSSSTMRKAIDTTEQGIEVGKDLVKYYNKIATWCGLPKVPGVFL